MNKRAQGRANSRFYLPGQQELAGGQRFLVRHPRPRWRSSDSRPCPHRPRPRTTSWTRCGSDPRSDGQRGSQMKKPVFLTKTDHKGTVAFIIKLPLS